LEQKIEREWKSIHCPGEKDKTLVSPSGMVETPRLQAKQSFAKWSK